MLFACGSAFLGLTLGRVDFGPRAFRAGGYLGEWIGGFMAEYLSRTGSVIVILALMVAAVILATQFSFGRLFAALFAALQGLADRGVDAFRLWREERRKARQRREVLVKYGKKDTVAESEERQEDRQDRPAGRGPGGARARRRRAWRDEDEPPVSRTPPVVQKKGVRTPVSAPLPLPEPERVERRLGALLAAAGVAARSHRRPSARSTSAS